MSDLMGYRDARGDYHRYRFMGFGACQSPFWQQRWGGIIRKILNTHGLKYCKGAAADYSTFTCAMCYVDDFACVHTGAATDPVIAREQFESVLRVLKDIGIEEKVSKRNYPDTKLELLGFVVDTVAQTVSITEARRDKLGKLIAAELSNDASDADRRDLASLVGQLQWVAQIIPGGQLHLRRAYRARDDFTAEHVANLPLKARWARGIRVHLLADLQWWARELPLIVGKPIFLSNLAMPNGFWMGSIANTDKLLDACGGVTPEDIEVITTDASGFAGGGCGVTSERPGRSTRTSRPPPTAATTASCSRRCSPSRDGRLYYAGAASSSAPTTPPR